MSKIKKLKKEIEKQNDFLFKRIESQNESIRYQIEALIEDYSKNYMLMHLLVGKIRPSDKKNI